MVEILDKTTQVGLEDERLFPMTCVALKALKAANLENAVASPECYTAGYLLKTLAVLGFRPRFDTCGLRLCCSALSRRFLILK